MNINTNLDIRKIFEIIYQRGVEEGVKRAKLKLSKKFSYKLKIYLTELLWSL